MRQNPIVLKSIQAILTSTLFLRITLVTSLKTCGNWFCLSFTSVIWFSKAYCLIQNITNYYFEPIDNWFLSLISRVWNDWVWKAIPSWILWPGVCDFQVTQHKPNPSSVALRLGHAAKSIKDGIWINISFVIKKFEILWVKRLQDIITPKILEKHGTHKCPWSTGRPSHIFINLNIQSQFQSLTGTCNSYKICDAVNRLLTNLLDVQVTDEFPVKFTNLFLGGTVFMLRGVQFLN